MYWFLKCLFIIPTKLLIWCKAINKKAIPKTGSAIIYCNHLSNWDPVLLAINSKRRIKFLAKKELFDKKIIGWIYKKLGFISIDRGNTSVSTVKEILTALKNGQLIGIFPEGTRNKKDDGSLLEFKDGIVTFAIKTNATLVPAKINRRPKIFRRVKITFGDSFKLDKDNPNNKEIIVEKIKNIK